MFNIKPLTGKALAAVLVAAFFFGWFSYAYYLYTNQILLVKIEGPIYDFQEASLAFYKGKTDRNAKAIVLYLNTPGGAAYSCMEIAKYINETRDVKPVIATMGAECASGGYYIASFADHIFTHENTLTGGVGVIAVWVDMSEFYRDQGIVIHVWKTGTEKDLGAEWRPPTEEENASIQEEVNKIFDAVLYTIQKNRELSDEVMDIIAGGGTFSGSTAVEELGLADEIGNIVDAEEGAAETAGLWKSIVVTPEMDCWERFLKALF